MMQGIQCLYHDKINQLKRIYFSNSTFILQKCLFDWLKRHDTPVYGEETAEA